MYAVDMEYKAWELCPESPCVFELFCIDNKFSCIDDGFYLFICVLIQSAGAHSVHNNTHSYKHRLSLKAYCLLASAKMTR
jgi:hypothetical protein